MPEGVNPWSQKPVRASDIIETKRRYALEQMLAALRRNPDLRAELIEILAQPGSPRHLKVETPCETRQKS